MVLVYVSVSCMPLEQCDVQPRFPEWHLAKNSVAGIKFLTTQHTFPLLVDVISALVYLKTVVTCSKVAVKTLNEGSDKTDRR